VAALSAMANDTASSALEAGHWIVSLVFGRMVFGLFCVNHIRIA
jgi:hypothetical protein